MTEAIILIFSTLTIFGGLYIRYLIRQIKNISDDFVIIRTILLDYNESLKAIYETEMFYGEPVLQALVEETKEITGHLKSIIEDYDYEAVQDYSEEEEVVDEEA